MGIYLIVKNEIKRSIKNKKKLMITLIYPVIAIIIAIGINAIMKPSINLGIIDKENSQIGANFKMKAGDIDGVKIDKANEDSINADLIMAKYVATIKFDPNNNIKLYCLDNELKDNIQEIVNNFSDTKDLTGLHNMLIKMREDSMTSAERSSSFILLTLVVTCIFASCNIIKDKEDGVLKRYVLTTNAPQVYILGNFIFNFITTLSQIIISTLILGVLSINIGINLLQFLIIGIVIAFTTCSIATMVVSLVNTELKASLIASSFAMIMSLLGGAFLPLEKMPDGIKIISNVSITKWIIDLTKALENNKYNVQQLAPAIVIILISVMFLYISTAIGKRKFV